MMNTNIWTEISNGMDIVSNALRGISAMLNGPQLQGYPQPVMGPPNVDVNMSRRDLPENQQPQYMGYYNNNYNMPNAPYINNYGYPAPPQNQMYTPPIPGMSDPRYGIQPMNTRDPWFFGMNNNYMNANPNTGMYYNLPTYTSPFQQQNATNTVYGIPGGGSYGY